MEPISERPALPKLTKPLLHSSCVPTEAERLFVDKVIDETMSILSDVDSEIARLKASLAALESHREDVQTHALTAHAVLSPIRHLPPEILEEIFHHATSGSKMSWPPRDHEGSSSVRSGDLDRIPWRIAAVCSYWRTTVLSLPDIWSNIQLDLSFERLSPGLSSFEISRSIHKFLNTSLLRSGKALVSFSLKYSTDVAGLQGEAIRDIVCSLLIPLVEVSGRWEDVTLDLEDLFSFHALLSPAVDRVPNLKRLYLASPGHSFTTPRPWHAIDAFSIAPKLRQLTLIHIPHPTLHLRLPWEQLTYLRSRGSHFHEGEFTKLLRSAQSLQEFTTEDERVLDMAAPMPVVSTPLSAASNNSAVHLPHLRSLSVTNKGSYISRIFQLITAPSLASLSIHSRTAYSADHAISMLRRSFCTFQLRSLTLESSRDLDVVWEENYGVVCLLAELKGVEELVLRISKASDEIIPRLTVRRGMGGNPQRNAALMSYANPGNSNPAQPTPKQGTVLLPNLKSFSLEDSFCASAGELKEMLQSRIASSSSMSPENGGPTDGVARLKNVFLKLSRPPPPSYVELEALGALAREKDLEIDIVV